LQFPASVEAETAPGQREEGCGQREVGMIGPRTSSPGRRSQSRHDRGSIPKSRWIADDTRRGEATPTGHFFGRNAPPSEDVPPSEEKKRSRCPRRRRRVTVTSRYARQARHICQRHSRSVAPGDDGRNVPTAAPEPAQRIDLRYAAQPHIGRLYPASRMKRHGHSFGDTPTACLASMRLSGRLVSSREDLFYLKEKG
jgi:hypothetical protein